MAREHPILLVDDNHGFAEDAANALRLRNLTIDVCHDVNAAKERLSRRLYDVAIVDINLSGEPDDRSGGLELINFIKGLGEGTAIVVVTGQDSPQFSADLLQDMHVQRFVFKQEIIASGPKVLLDRVESALQTAKPLIFGKAATITQVICGSPDQVCVDSLLRRLTPKNTFQGLERFLTSFLEPVLPLLPPVALDPPWLALDAHTLTFSGQFWSKGVGCAVLVSIAKVGAKLEVWESTSRIHSHESAGLVGTIDASGGDRLAYSG